MTEYFVTTRNIKRAGQSRVYGTEIAEPTYVIAAEDATTMTPDDRVRGRNAGLRWGRKVVEEAKLKWAAANPNIPNSTEQQGDIVVFIHGFNVDAQEAFETHKTLANNLQAGGLTDAVFVSYSWPANGDVLSYIEDDSDARETAVHLVKSALAVFAQLSTPECRVKVHVMAHSMGCLVVREALRSAPGSKLTRDGAWGITNLITFGADISVRSVRRSDGDRLIGKSQRYTNYFNRHDGVLATSNAKRFATARRLGRHGAPSSRLDEMVDIDVTQRWEAVEDQFPSGVVERVSASHNFYFSDTQFGKDAADTIKGLLDRRLIPTRDDREVEAGRLRLKP